MDSEAFRQEIEKQKREARANGQKYVDIRSGDVHAIVGGYPGTNHRMPACCNVMYSMMGKNDGILNAPFKGKGASLKIRYYL
jgi:hypothetical protein